MLACGHPVPSNIPTSGNNPLVSAELTTQILSTLQFEPLALRREIRRDQLVADQQANIYMSSQGYFAKDKTCLR